MKKIIFILICCFLFCTKLKSQINKELRDSIKLPRLEIKNKELEKQLISELIDKNKNDWNPSLIYSIEISENEKNTYKLIITISTICNIKDSVNIGFFKIEDYIFIVRGIYRNALYSISSEEKTFECIKYYRIEDGILEPILPIRTEFPIWNYSFKKNKLKCLKVMIFN